MVQKKQQPDISDSRGFHSLDRRPRSSGAAGQGRKQRPDPGKAKKTGDNQLKPAGKKKKNEAAAGKKRAKPQRHLTRAEKSRRDILYDTKSFDIVAPESVKQESQRKKRRKRVHPISVIVVSLGVLFIAALAGIFLIFKVDAIDITGESIYTKEEILAATGFEPGDNLFFLPIAEVEKTLPGALPYIESVTITRELPHKVILDISAVTPGGVLQYGSQYVLIDSQGKVIAVRDDQMLGVMEIRGVEIEEPAIGDPVKVTDTAKNDVLRNILKQLEASGALSETTSLNISDLLKMELTYQNRIKIRLGSVSELPYKIRYSMSIVMDPQKTDVNERGTFDVTLSAGNRTAYYKVEQKLNNAQQGSAESTGGDEESSVQAAPFTVNIGRGSDIPDKPYTGNSGEGSADENSESEEYEEDYGSDEYTDETEEEYY